MPAKIEYAFTLTQEGGDVMFNVTRSRQQRDSDPVLWVSIRGPEGADLVVIWGTTVSLEGHTQAISLEPGEYVAKLTETPWHPRRSDPEIAFAVA